MQTKLVAAYFSDPFSRYYCVYEHNGYVSARKLIGDGKWVTIKVIDSTTGKPVIIHPAGCSVQAVDVHLKEYLRVNDCAARKLNYIHGFLPASDRIVTPLLKVNYANF